MCVSTADQNLVLNMRRGPSSIGTASVMMARVQIALVLYSTGVWEPLDEFMMSKAKKFTLIGVLLSPRCLCFCLRIPPSAGCIYATTLADH